MASPRGTEVKARVPRTSHHLPPHPAPASQIMEDFGPYPTSPPTKADPLCCRQCSDGYQVSKIIEASVWLVFRQRVCTLHELLSPPEPSLAPWKDCPSCPLCPAICLSALSLHPCPSAPSLRHLLLSDSCCACVSVFLLSLEVLCFSPSPL